MKFVPCDRQPFWNGRKEDIKNCKQIIYAISEYYRSINMLRFKMDTKLIPAQVLDKNRHNICGVNRNDKRKNELANHYKVLLTHEITSKKAVRSITRF